MYQTKPFLMILLDGNVTNNFTKDIPGDAKETAYFKIVIIYFLTIFFYKKWIWEESKIGSYFSVTQYNGICERSIDSDQKFLLVLMTEQGYYMHNMHQ